MLLREREEAELNRINGLMVGSIEPVLPELIAHKLVEKHGTQLVMTPLARVMAEHFIGMERLPGIGRLTKCNTEPLDIIVELESEDMHRDQKPEKKKGPGDRRSGDRKAGERLREPEKRTREPEKPKHQQTPGRHQPDVAPEKGTHKKGRGRR